MKICYDNLEGMYLTLRGNMKKGNHIYEINPNVCKTCKQEFLSCKNRVSEYCSKSCNAKTTSVGHTLSLSVRKKLSEIHKGSLNHMYGRFGELSPVYKPEISKKDRESKRLYTDYYLWRKSVFERDDYTCQYCGERGGVINAHHIESYADNVEVRTSLDNGITLCKKCHKDFHHQYGKGKNTYIQFNEFLNKEDQNGRLHGI